ncbi:MAG: acetyl-CoA carboxylase carboxyltransferase subunit beta [Alphaproteobacteria bacterium]|nr:acetyl-CoA carboxylase carboxyltransferase subunit beta [Alphaproteobacteria bacterium]
MAGQGRRWFEQSKGFEARTRTSDDADDGPDLWTKCPGCGEALFLEVLAEHLEVCPHCGHHFPVEALQRLLQLADEDALELHDTGLTSVDALGFVDSKPYDRRLVAAREKLGRNEAFVAASAHVEGIPVELGAMDWRFLGGSMGSVVGEAVTRLFERATVRRVPALVVSASGGARMQEGVLSLMQMAKTSAAIARLKDEARMPYLSLLTHPTTGGVAASFSTLGDVLIAEPGALVGFAGPRVIKETIGEELPAGFQTAEYLLEHGMVDLVVPRGRLRPTVARLLRLLLDQRESA